MTPFLKTLLQLARASNLPTAWSNVLCAFLLVGSFNGLAFLAAIVAVSLLYVGGMYLNDWRDAEHDGKYQSYRPIPSKLISRRAVFLFASLYFLAALCISFLLQPVSLLWALGLVVCITVYDLDHKNNALSPWIMAGCRALIYPWAAAISGQDFTVGLWLACAAAYSYTLGLTYIARGVLPLPYKLVFCLAVLLPGYLWVSYMGGELVFWGLLALLAFLLWMAHCLSGIFRNPPRIGFTVGNLIAGFCFIDLLSVAVVTAYAPLAVVAFSLLFMATLKFQKHISGT